MRHAIWSTGRYAIVPPVVTGVVLPAGLLLAHSSEVPEITMMYIDHATRLLIPALAAWWPAFVFKERIEGDGRELLYFLRRDGEGLVAFSLALLYWLLLVPFVVIALGTSYFPLAALPMLLARCFFVATLTFFAAFTLQSGVLSLVLVWILNLVAMSPLESIVEASAQPTHTDLGILAPSAIVAYMLLSAALLWFGRLKSRCFTG